MTQITTSKLYFRRSNNPLSNTVSPRKKMTCIVSCKQNKSGPIVRFLIIVILRYYFGSVWPNLLLNLNILHWSMKTFVMVSTFRTNLYTTYQNPIFTYSAISNNELDKIHWLCSQNIKVVLQGAFVWKGNAKKYE